MGYYNEWKEMSMTKKLGLMASLSAILGVVLTAYSTFVASDNSGVTQTVNGKRSTVIGKNTGNVTINLNDTTKNSEHLVLRNRKTGVSLVLSEPSLDVITDESKHVCNAISGTPVAATGNIANMNGIPMWKEVNILKGACAGRKGWVSVSVLSFE